MSTLFSLHREVLIPQPVATVFPFFAQAENLEQITPPWLHFRITTPPPIEMRTGARIGYRLRVRGIPLRWLTEIESWNPPFSFIDTQLRGPYSLWRHTHTFIDHAGATLMIDHVDYELPFGPLGRLVHALQVRRDVETIFDYRNQQIRLLFG